MEFGGVLGLDGLVMASSLDHTDNTELPMKQRSLFGAGFLKHGRSAAASAADHEQQQLDWRSLKLARTSDGNGEQMLSFSSSKSPADHAALYLNSNDGYSLSSASAYQHQYHPSYAASSSSANSCYMNAGLACGGTNVSSIHGVRGPFTPSQWMELEHQALIYKYIDANIPIPSSLLLPIRRSTNPSPISPFLSGSYRSTTLGWRPFHIGFSGNSDPEPGRCRRTDGKKWRCSRDAVADQKYCERHMNRGRHRSRKHVEGQSGHASKAMATIATTESTAAVSGGGGLLSSTLPIPAQKIKSLQRNEPSPPRLNGNQMSKDNVDDHVRDSDGLTLLADASPKPLDSLFPISKHHNPFERTPSRPDFGLISTDSLLNPPRTSYSDDIGLDSNSKLNDRQPQHHPFRHFIDDWPKSQSDLTSIAWPKMDETNSDRTQLSISIPTDLSSSCCSPLRLSRDFNPMNGVNQCQAGWIPISWEPTIGGPLGEVLNKTNATLKDVSRNCSSSALNLLSGGWDTSPRVESSPTGVLQKTAFGSLSSSTGSSPRADNHRSTGSHCDDLLGSTLVNPSTVPSL